MQILILGSGGREHAMAWKLARSRRVQQVFVAPGNGGTAREPRIQNLALDPVRQIDELIAFAKAEKIGLTVVGPEAPLAAGAVDAFRSAGLPIFGPQRLAAQLESSKDFAKQFMKRHGIPTAAFETFTDPTAAIAYIQRKVGPAGEQPGAPIVVKADGLAAGKGVVVAASHAEAEAAVRDMLEGNRFGAAGARVVIEDFLPGEEASFMVVCDGKMAVPLATSQDHKRVGDGDTGPNTGGMGAYSPAPVVTTEVHARVMREIINPVLRGMAAEGQPYTGFLYAGLMISPDGVPKVVEFNCRMGDPETQPIFMRLRGDILPILEAAAAGRLEQVEQLADGLWDPRPAVGVVLAAGNYPEAPRTGDAIHGLPIASQDFLPHGIRGNDDTEVMVFHAGTRLAESGEVLTTGGRVLCVTALGPSLRMAQQAAYAQAAQIGFEGMHYRRDIGWRALQKLPS